MTEGGDWLIAIKAFREDVNATVVCPKCKKGNLTILDVPFDEENKKRGGRYLKCLNCGVVEIVLYRYPPDNWLQH